MLAVIKYIMKNYKLLKDFSEDLEFERPRSSFKENRYKVSPFQKGIFHLVRTPNIPKS